MCIRDRHGYREALDCEYWPVLNLPGRDAPVVTDPDAPEPPDSPDRDAGDEHGDERSGL